MNLAGSRVVLVLCEYPTLNGGERSLLAALPSLIQAGFRTKVAAPATGPLSEELARQGIEHVSFSSRDSAGVNIERDQARANLRQLLIQTKPALLHANSLSMGRLSGPVATELSLPSIAHLRDIVGLSAAAVADLNRHTRLIAVSEATRAFHIAQGVSAEKTTVLHNGVDLQLFRPRERLGGNLALRPKLDWPADALVAGTIGQIILRKGQDVLARAAARLARDEDVSKLHWIIVGQRHSSKPETVAYEQTIERTFAEAGLCHRVAFMVACSDVPTLLGEFDMLVHPARQEPLGRVLLEAAGAGLPIVATAVGGTREILTEDSAVLVPPDDEAVLADAMRRLATTPSLRVNLGKAARQRAEQHFDARLSGERLAAIYRAVLDTVL